MVYYEPIEGKYVSLKSCTEEDAVFTLDLRKDPQFSSFLPSIDITVEEQIAWINKQRNEAGDYFFVIWGKVGERIGTVSVYNIRGKTAETGRLVMRAENPLQALEAELLAYRFAFYTLGVMLLDGFIYADNHRALRFNKQFGGKHYPPAVDNSGHSIVRFEHSLDDFKKAEVAINRFLYRSK